MKIVLFVAFLLVAVDGHHQYKAIDNSCTRISPAAASLTNLLRKAFDVHCWSDVTARCAQLYFASERRLPVSYSGHYYLANDTDFANKMTMADVHLMEDASKRGQFEHFKAGDELPDKVSVIVAYDNKGFALVTCPAVDGNVKIDGYVALIKGATDEQLVQKLKNQLENKLGSDVTLNEVDNDDCPE